MTSSSSVVKRNLTKMRFATLCLAAGAIGAGANTAVSRGGTLNTLLDLYENLAEEHKQEREDKKHDHLLTHSHDNLHEREHERDEHKKEHDVKVKSKTKSDDDKYPARWFDFQIMDHGTGPFALDEYGVEPDGGVVEVLDKQARISRNFEKARAAHVEKLSKSNSKADGSSSSAIGIKTWKQRYFLNTDFYKPGGPLFLVIGGEGMISARYVGESYLAYFLAKKWNGVVATLEHRYYGLSQPTETASTENLEKYLSSQQALADLATFTLFLKEQNLPPSMNPPKLEFGKVLSLGGSYPGSLSAWVRQEYPAFITGGALAFSAPVFAQSDFGEYGEMVYAALNAEGERLTREAEAALAKFIDRAVDVDAHGVKERTKDHDQGRGHKEVSINSAGGGGAKVLDLGQKLKDGYNAIFAKLRSGSTAVRHEILKEKLNACPYSVLSSEDVSNVESMVSTALSGVVQYNNSMPVGRGLAAFAELVAGAESPEAAAWGVTKLLITDAEEDEILQMRRNTTNGTAVSSGDVAHADHQHHVVDSKKHKSFKSKKRLHQLLNHNRHANKKSQHNSGHDLKASDEDCVDLSLRGSYESLSVQKWNNKTGDARAWVFQTCNEFGYFQTASVEKKHFTPSLGGTIFTPGVSDPALWTGLCQAVYNKEYAASDVEAAITKTNFYYQNVQVDPVTGRMKRSGAREEKMFIKNTVYINGQYDPWSILSRKSVLQQMDKYVEMEVGGGAKKAVRVEADNTSNENEHYAFVVSHGSHCAGLYGAPDDVNIDDSAREVQKQIVDIVSRPQWLGAAPNEIEWKGDGEKKPEIRVQRKSQNIGERMAKQAEEALWSDSDVGDYLTV